MRKGPLWHMRTVKLSLDRSVRSLIASTIFNDSVSGQQTFSFCCCCSLFIYFFFFFFLYVKLLLLSVFNPFQISKQPKSNLAKYIYCQRTRQLTCLLKLNCYQSRYKINESEDTLEMPQSQSSAFKGTKRRRGEEKTLTENATWNHLPTNK